MDFKFREWDFESEEFISTQTFLRKLKKQITSHDGEIQRLDFSALQILTDEVFFGLQTLQTDKNFREFLGKVVDIDLSGCVHITDNGLDVIANTFPHLKKLTLDGCRKVTEKGLVSVFTEDLELSVVGCSGIRVPLSCIKAKPDDISDPIDAEQAGKKLVILSDDLWRYSLLRFLHGETQEFRDKCEDVLYRKITSQSEEGGISVHFNIFETITYYNLTGPVLSEKAVYVLAFPCNKNLLLNIMAYMNAVKGLETTPEFVLVLLHNTATRMDENTSGVGIEKVIKERLEVHNTALLHQIEDEMFDSAMVKTCDFQAQLRMSRGMALKDKSTQAVKFSIFRLNLDTGMVELQYQSEHITKRDDRVKRMRAIEELKKTLETKLEQYYPVYERALQSLNSLNKSDITEIKSFAKPPAAVEQVVEGLLIIFGQHHTTWRSGKVLMSNANMIGMLVDFNLETALTPSVVENLEAFMNRVDLSHEKLRSISTACSCFWLWISAVYQYCTDILPLQQQLKQLQEDPKPQPEKPSQSMNEEELYKMQEDLKKQLNEQKAMKGEVANLLKDVKKADLTELKNFKRPPATVSEVLGGVAIILNVKPKQAGNYWAEMNQVIGKGQLLNTLQNLDLDLSKPITERLRIYMDNINVTEESLRKVSKICVPLWKWVTNVYKYNKESSAIKDKIATTEAVINEYEAVLEKNVLAQKGPGLLLKHLEGASVRLEDREPILRSGAWTDGVKQVWGAIDKLRQAGTRVCSWLIVQKELSADINDHQLSAALQRFHYQGHIFYYPDLEGRPVVLDVDWYIKCLNDTLVTVKGHVNKNRCVALPTKTPLFVKETFYKQWDCLQKELEGEILLTVLKHTGVLLDVPRLAADEHRNKDLLYINKYLEVKPALRIRSDEDHVSYSDFKTNVWPEKRVSKYLDGDRSVTYKYVLNYGLPPALFSQLLAECIKLGQVIHIWATGFVVRCGAVDICIQQHTHAFNLTSSIEVNARTNSICEDASVQVLQDYMWSTVNPYLLVLDYLMEHYQLSYRMRIPCLGSCSNTELGHNFSSVELKQEHNYQLHCTLCGDQQMSTDTCGYLTGKRGLLPIHDFMDPEEKDIHVGENSPYGMLWNRETVDSDDQLMWVCGHCGISKQAANHLWKMQCTVYPIPDSLAFTPSHGNGHSLYHIKVPLYLQGLLDIHATLLKDMQVKFIVAKEDYFKSGVFFDDPEELRQARLVYDLKTGVVEQITGSGTRERLKQSIESISVGDRFSVEATASMLVDMPHIDEWWVMIGLVLKKNGREIHRTKVPYRSHVGIFLKSSCKEARFGTEEGVMVECPTFPYVQASHFPLGQAVFYKTGLGNQWALAQVHSTEQGRVSVKSEKGEVLTPTPEDVLPVALYSDITVTIGGEVLRNKEHIVQYLLSKKMEPVPYGLFTHLYYRRGTYSTVYLRRHHMARVCTWKSSSAAALEQLFNKYVNSEGKAGKFTPATYHILLPHGLSHKYLVHASRQVVQDWSRQNIYFLCRGIQWVTYGSHFRDMHLLSKGPSLEGAANICQKLRSCQRSNKQRKKQAGEASPENADDSEGNEADKKVHLHAGDQIQVVMAYHFMLKNKSCLPDEQKRRLIFQDADKDETLSESDVAGLYRMFSIYKDTFLLLDRILEVAYNYDFTKLHTSYRVYNRFLVNLYKETIQTSEKKNSKSCKAHDMLGKKTSFQAASSQDESSEDPFGFQTNLDGYAGCITFLNITGVGPIGKFLKKFLSFLPNLRGLALQKCNLKSIEGVEQCRRLVYLDVASNHIPDILSENLQPLTNTLEVLNVSSNPITDFPPIISRLLKLRQLLIGDTLIKQLPADIGQLTSLRVLNMKVTLVTELPSSIINCRMIHFLNLQGVPWLGRFDNVSTFDQWKKWAQNHTPTKNLPLREMFDEANVTKDLILSEEEQEILNQRLIDMFPRIGRDKPEDDEYGGIPKEVFCLRNLRTLALGGQLIHRVPDKVSKLRRLQHLLLFYNPNLQGVSAQLGKANVIQTLSLGGCPKCKTPPQEIIDKGMKVILAYIKKLAQGSTACNRTKLMFVGLGGAGKTSLTRALMSPEHKAPVMSTEAITDGIDISTWSVKQDSTTLQYSVWDFAGQTVYYNTHQFFLSNRALYLLVWNTRLGYEHSGLDFWLSSIACHCPRAPVFVVGTHADQITKTELPKGTLKEKHPKIAGFFTVSSTSGKGIRELYEKIIKVTLQQPYMGEMIPESWLSFERVLMHKRGNESLLDWEDLKADAHTVGIYGDEVLQSVRFLHELGALQHFENEFLKDKVVINPQWIIDVMACVVSVHNKVIVDGHLDHKDIALIWKNYPENIHEWLLRLTEVFDLTFALSEKPVSVVPCLLPQEAPSYHWPRLEELEGAKETKILYTFDYLPSGLCNRAQVRLCQFSDTSKMWKMGSVLVKNGHYALIQQISPTRVLVKVIGQRPENILLMIHEVFESLIADFFQGIKYEYQIPCPDCIEVHIEDPTMFSSKVLRKAIEMKALFLQCHCLFHTLSIADVQGLMPPQSGTDYALQLENVVRDLDDLEGVIGTDVFFMYCEGDLPDSGERVVDIRTVKADLDKRGYKCWFSERLGRLQIEQLAVAMKNSKLILVFISDDFVLDEGCKRMFKFAKESLRKDMQLVMVGKGREWMKNEFIGIQVTDEVFVNLQRLHQYNDRFEELCRRIQQKMGKVSHGKEERFDVFLSYAWTNSQTAIEHGQAKAREGSLGDGDPRAIKDFLLQHGVSVWIDVEQVGRMGLYEDIAQGLKQSKIMVACISDEYALSNNCQIEFRFANTSLKKPIILAVVGTGFMWESTEIGMLSLGYPKTNFQVANNLCHEQLLRYVQEALDSVEDNSISGSRPLTPSSLTQKEMAFQELFEMAQRKFLRQVSSYVKNSDPYPRLFVADLNYDPTEVQEEGEAALEDTDLILDEDMGQKVSFVVDDLRSGQFCIKALCEYEGGWHSVDEGLAIDLTGRDLLTMWKLLSPYMARLLAILKHSNINLHIVRTSEGEKLQRSLEEMMSTEMQHVDLRPLYLALRSYVIHKDSDNKKGNLSMCYLPSGKTLWLCEEHQKQPRITVLEIPEMDTPPVKDNAEIMLMSALEALYQKETDSLPADQGELVKPPSHAARHTRPVSGRAPQGARVMRKISKANMLQPQSNPGRTLNNLPIHKPDVKPIRMEKPELSKAPVTPLQNESSDKAPVTPLQNESSNKAPVTPLQSESSSKTPVTAVQSESPAKALVPPVRSHTGMSRPGTSEQPVLSSKEREQLVKKASKQNMASVMSNGSFKSGDPSSQACVLL